MSNGQETQNSETSETAAETTTTEETTTESLITKSEGETTETAATEFVPLTPTDITFPEGLEVSDDIRDEFLGVINNRELSAKDQAQALVALQEKAAQAASEANSGAWATQQKAWQDEVKADPELGGGNLQTTLSSIGSLVEQFGNDELLQVMAATGAGNNVHVIRFLSKIAAVVTEGRPATGTPSAQEGTAASRMYPTMKG